MDNVRHFDANEWKTLAAVAFDIPEASAKIRSGPPKDDIKDYPLDI